jgi:hypothetical protein
MAMLYYFGWYCPCHFTWRLHCVVVIWLGSLRLSLCNGTAKQVFTVQIYIYIWAVHNMSHAPRAIGELCYLVKRE